jgi:sarcosine/dimethylglycine N-methyltransferase
MATDVAHPSDGPDFAKMGIYVDGRLKNELDELLKTKSSSDVTARDVYAMSCMHYLDDEPMRHAAEYFGLATAGEDGGSAGPRKILDFGAGFAGDARVMAEDFAGCELTCVEVQPHIHAAAQNFTDMLHVSNRCKHACVDVFENDVPGAPFDHLFSVLAILHVPQRDLLWTRLAENLKPGGTVYVEDYFARRPLTDQDKAQLAGPVACPYLPSEDEYLATLASRGFVDVRWETMNDRWEPFVESRLEGFRAARERHLRVHGESLVGELDLFYSTVRELFARGNLGGVRIRARLGGA